MDDVEEKVKEIISEQLGTPVSDISSDSSFADLGADDNDMLEMMIAFEQEFGIDIPHEQKQKIVTVGDAISFLELNSM